VNQKQIQLADEDGKSWRIDSAKSAAQYHVAIVERAIGHYSTPE
jgi:hypothetical protein